MTAKKSGLYPLKFFPILKEKVWGGSKLSTILNKDGIGKIGESWEISGVEDNISIVRNGHLKGKTLDWILEEYTDKLVGNQVYKHFGNKFPLLFKFIDAAQDLSVQVHPDDELAAARHHSFGKTEMWYVLQSDETARLIIGFKNDSDKTSYLEAVSEGRILDELNSIPVKTGDSFVINPGTVHAIGAGVLLAEIQQTSDITYRIYDWDRPGDDGKMRELHTENAVDAINFSSFKKQRTQHQQVGFESHIGETQFFSINKLDFSQSEIRSLEKISSFTVYMCLDGKAILEGDEFSETIEKGETILIPAYIHKIRFNTKAASFLEVYIP